MTKRQQRQLIGLVLALVLAGLGWAGQQFGWIETAEEEQPGLYRVVSVSDGDTITVDMHGTDETIRFIGVDTPETHHPNLPVQCFGPEASDFTRQLVAGQKVRLEADPTNQNRDRYDRLLRYVYLSDGQLVQAEIIRQGYGFAYTSFPFVKKDEFVGLESTAQANKLGLWDACQITDQNGRKQTNPQ